MNQRSFHILPLVTVIVLAVFPCWVTALADDALSSDPLESDSLSAEQPRLEPLSLEVEMEWVPSKPRMGSPLELRLALLWSGVEPVAIRPVGWGTVEGLEPLWRGETQTRTLLSGAVLENRSLLQLRFRPLREGEVDLSSVLLLLQRGGQTDTVALPHPQIEIAAAPLLTPMGWAVGGLVALLLAGVAVGVVRWKKRAVKEGEERDPKELDAERWRELKGQLRQSETDRRWLEKVSDLLRDQLLRRGGDPSLRTDELIALEIEKESDNSALVTAWSQLREEVVHYQYGGGVRPVHRNRETLQMVKLCLALNEEDLL